MGPNRRLKCKFCGQRYAANGMWRHHKRAHRDIEYPLDDMHEQLFWTNVESAPGMDCWRWTGFITLGGYGVFRVKGVGHAAHRWSYRALIGEIPDGLVLDHLCRVRECVNPYHLDPCTIAVNTARGIGNSMRQLKTHCPHGHEYAGDNLYIETSAIGGTVRHCRACRHRQTTDANALKLSRVQHMRDGTIWRRADGLSQEEPLEKGVVLQSDEATAKVTRVSRDGNWIDIRASTAEWSRPVRVSLPLGTSSVKSRIGVAR